MAPPLPCPAVPCCIQLLSPPLFLLGPAALPSSMPCCAMLHLAAPPSPTASGCSLLPALMRHPPPYPISHFCSPLPALFCPTWPCCTLFLPPPNPAALSCTLLPSPCPAAPSCSPLFSTLLRPAASLLCSPPTDPAASSPLPCPAAHCCYPCSISCSAQLHPAAPPLLPILLLQPPYCPAAPNCTLLHPLHSSLLCPAAPTLFPTQLHPAMPCCSPLLHLLLPSSPHLPAQLHPALLCCSPLSPQFKKKKEWNFCSLLLPSSLP